MVAVPTYQKHELKQRTFKRWKIGLPKPLVVGKDIIPPNKIIDNDEITSFDPKEDGIDFWESVEFMRVSFPNAKVVGPPYTSDVPIIVESTTNNELNVQGGLNIAKDDYNPEKIFLDIDNNSFVVIQVTILMVMSLVSFLMQALVFNF